MNEASRRFVTLPNLISAVRIILLVPLLLFFRAKMFVPTLLLFLVSAGSDALDGIIARRWNMQSEFGRILDPLADKVTFVTLIVIFSRNVLSVVPLAVLIAAEVILLVMGAYTYMCPQWQKWISLGANIYGKIKTCFETLLVLLLIIWHFFEVLHSNLEMRNVYLFSVHSVLFLCIIFAIKSIVSHVNSRPLR